MDRPILFSGAMVRAILAGTKTQTRRPVKLGPVRFVGANGDKGPDWNDPDCWGYEADDGLWYVLGRSPDSFDTRPIGCPFGVPGDRLWARETWGLHAYGDPTDWHRGSLPRGLSQEAREIWDLAYRADWQVEDGTTHWRPSIHMPRWASRITLDITGLRVERLQEISEADAQAEGLTPTMGGGYWEGYDRDPDGARGTHCSCLSPEVEPPEWMLEPFWRAPYTLISARDHFAGLWAETYGAESWAENPWVWVVTFKAVPRG